MARSACGCRRRDGGEFTSIRATGAEAQHPLHHGRDQKTAMSIGGSLGAPMTAFQYDFNILPLGQQLWLAHLETFQKFPPLQAPESYNLSQVYEEIKKAGQHHPSE